MKYLKVLFIGIAFICIFSSCGQDVDVKPEDRILMVNDKLYYGTTETGPMGSSDAIEGKIQSTVNANEIPQKNGQSNFGEEGASYTDDPDLGFIMVQINNEWYVFYTEQQENPVAQPETKDEPLYSSQPLPYEIGQVSVISNNAKYEPYTHMSSAQVVIDGRAIDGVGKFLSLEEVSESLLEIQYADDFQVIVEGEDAEIPAYSLYNDKFENLYSYQNDLSIPSEAGIYLLFVAVTWSNGEVNTQYKEYTLNEYIFKIQV